MDIKKLQAGRRVVVRYLDTNINGEFVKKLREKYKLTQIALANVLGVSKKTIEKWEQGVNSIKGSSAVLLSLIDEYPDILSRIREVKIVPAKYSMTFNYSDSYRENGVTYTNIDNMKVGQLTQTILYPSGTNTVVA